MTHPTYVSEFELSFSLPVIVPNSEPELIDLARSSSTNGSIPPAAADAEEKQKGLRLVLELDLE